MMWLTRTLAPSALLLALLSASASANAEPAPVPSTADALPATQAKAAATMLTERSALDNMRDRNLTIVALRLELSQARARTLAAGVLPNPEVGFGANFLAHGAATGGQQEFGVSIAQPIPISGAIAARQRAAESLEASTERAFTAAAWELSADLRERYLAAQLAESRARQLESTQQDLLKLDQIIDLRTKSGAASQYDRLRVQVEVRKLEARRARTNIEVELRHVDLAKAIGDEEIARGYRVVDLPEPRLPASSLGDHLSRALTQPLVEAQRLRVEAARRTTVSVRRAFIPNPRINVGYTLALGIPTDTGSDRGGMISAGISMPIPVFDRGQGVVDEKRMDEGLEAAKLRQIELNLRHAVSAADFAYRAQVAAYTHYRNDALVGAARLRSIAELGYREGRGSILELVDAYKAYAETEEQGLELWGDALLRGLQLQRVVGPSAPN